jgi:predicted TIM-barrel fold metal-dependent hydrolase
MTRPQRDAHRDEVGYNPAFCAIKFKEGAAGAARFFSRANARWNTMTPARIVDIHPHIISTDTQRYPVTPLGGKQSGWSKERPITFEQLVAAMDEAGVAKAAIVHSSTTYGFNNQYLADVLAGNTKRFTGVFSIDVLAADAPQKMRHWHSLNMTGMRIYSGGSNITMDTRLDDARSFPAWECAEALGIPVAISLFPAKLAELTVLIKRFPKVRIVIDGMLKPPIDEGEPYAGCAYLFDLAQYSNVYFKLATNNIRNSRKGKATPESFFPRLVKEIPSSRIAWCSNYPASKGTLVEIVNEAKSALACLPAEDQEWLFHRTSESLYPALV